MTQEEVKQPHFYDNPENWPDFLGTDPRIVYGNREGRPPLYEGDLGWTPELQKRLDDFYEMDRKAEFSKEDKKKHLNGIITELDKNIRANPKMTAGRNIGAYSEMMLSCLEAYHSIDIRN